MESPGHTVNTPSVVSGTEVRVPTASRCQKILKLKHIARIATLLTLQFVPMLADTDLVTAQRARVQACFKANSTITFL